MQLAMQPRKDLLLYTRVRNHPSRNRFFASMLKHYTRNSRVAKQRPSATTDQPTINMRELYDDLEHTTYLDITNSLLSMTLRNLPLLSRFYAIQENDMRKDSFLKEFQASQSSPRVQAYDYTCLFSQAPGSAFVPFHVLLPPRPALAMELRRCLDVWKGRVQGRVIFPKYSKKTMGERSSDELCRAEGYHRNEYRRRSTLDYEKFYCRTGRKLEGPAQMRQSFGHNDLRPRTYFALGITNYNASRFVQPIFNSLLDVFEMTHRYKRFNLRRVQVLPSDYCIVYDFSAFTSKMCESRYFTTELANFATGVKVLVLDTYIGLIEVDLGEMLHEYNEVNNYEPLFEIDDALRELNDMADLVHCHKCCGMLGVHGNLAGCTVLHGIILAFVTGSVKKCSCVGDDALAVCEIRINSDVEEGEEPLLTTAYDAFVIIKDAGELQMAKTRQFFPLDIEEVEDEDSDDWTYLKRRLQRDITGFSMENQFPFPHWSWVFMNEIKTTRKLKFKATPEEIIPRVITQCYQLIDKVHLQYMDGYTFDANDVRTMWQYLKEIYDEFCLPWNGHIKGRTFGPGSRLRYLRAEKFCFFVPRLPMNHVDDWESYLVRGPIEVLMDFDGDDYVVNAPIFSDELVSTFEGNRMKPMEKFEATGQKLFSVLEDLGYLRKTAMTRHVTSQGLADLFSSLLSRKSRIVYTYTVLDDLPHWVDDVMYAQSDMATC